MPDTQGESKARSPHLLCFGFGYVAKALALRLGPQGWSITGTSRATAAQSLDGAQILVFPTEQPDEVKAALASATAVLMSIPPGEGADPAFLEFSEIAGSSSPAWVGYLSTTGVYGDRRGRWAFEDDPVTPASPEATRRAAAEALWSKGRSPAHIFRLPGIYGPGRSPIDKLRAGSERRIDKPGQVFSRAHVDDIAAALEASIARPNPGRIYNVCDDEPAPTHEVSAFAAHLLGIEAPPLVPFDQADLSPMGRRFYSECKRVSNARLKAELGWRPKYPTYREGLKSILQAETSATS
ncbi:MAG: SDR family oxidoreductase [Caulobacterales bacterium]